MDASPPHMAGSSHCSPHSSLEILTRKCKRLKMVQAEVDKRPGIVENLRHFQFAVWVLLGTNGDTEALLWRAFAEFTSASPKR